MPGRAEGVAPCARGPIRHILLTYRWKIDAGKYGKQLLSRLCLVYCVCVCACAQCHNSARLRPRRVAIVASSNSSCLLQLLGVFRL